ncbi:MAG: nuclear transport factor 2 family protein [Myxococcota bacterium]|nr:nuclear transport factor 2 family protein [Myxococcota bacterium]
MGVVERFMAYAVEFEKTLADDDWSRLRPYFADDAVYRIESARFGCELEGRERIFAGMKKSLDGFDRNFDTRELAVTGGPDVKGDEMRVAWTVTYHKEGLPDYALRGRSLVRIPDERIVLLVDSFDDAAEVEMDDWARQTGVALDPSYT